MFTKAKSLLTVFVVLVDCRQLIYNVVAILDSLALSYRLATKYLLDKLIRTIASRAFERHFPYLIRILKELLPTILYLYYAITCSIYNDIRVRRRVAREAYTTRLRYLIA